MKKNFCMLCIVTIVVFSCVGVFAAPHSVPGTGSAETVVENVVDGK